MGSFFKTFFICLVISVGFLTYKYFSMESYNTELEVSKNSPVFGMHEELNTKAQKTQPNPPVTVQKTQNEAPKETEAPQIVTPVKYVYTCYFYSAKGQLVPLTRELKTKPTLEATIQLLLKGPTIPETKKGIYTEIPANVDLISVKNTKKGLIVDLTSNFGNGGGSHSVENRVSQLSKTIKNYSPKSKIYLYINGEEVEYLGGEGVFVKQPLE